MTFDALSMRTRPIGYCLTVFHGAPDAMLSRAFDERRGTPLRYYWRRRENWAGLVVRFGGRMFLRCINCNCALFLFRFGGSGMSIESIRYPYIGIHNPLNGSTRSSYSDGFHGGGAGVFVFPG